MEYEAGWKSKIGGYVGGEPEMVFTPNGLPKTTVSVGMGGGEGKPASWTRIVAFGPLAELLNEKLKKGCRVVIIARTSERYDKEKKKNYINSIAQMVWASFGKGEDLVFIGKDEGSGKKTEPVAAGAGETGGKDPF